MTSRIDISTVLLSELGDVSSLASETSLLEHPAKPSMSALIPRAVRAVRMTGSVAVTMVDMPDADNVHNVAAHDRCAGFSAD